MNSKCRKKTKVFSYSYQQL